MGGMGKKLETLAPMIGAAAAAPFTGGASMALMPALGAAGTAALESAPAVLGNMEASRGHPGMGAIGQLASAGISGAMGSKSSGSSVTGDQMQKMAPDKIQLGGQNSNQGSPFPLFDPLQSGMLGGLEQMGLNPEILALVKKMGLKL